MHYLLLSVGFLAASVLQAVIVFIFESVGITDLGISINFSQLIAHIAAGQVLGFLLVAVLERAGRPAGLPFRTLGTLAGLAALLILVPLNILAGILPSPRDWGLITFLAVMTSFLAYGVTAAYAIERSFERLES